MLGWGWPGGYGSMGCGMGGFGGMGFGGPGAYAVARAGWMPGIGCGFRWRRWWW